jgi:hypothetical protein
LKNIRPCIDIFSKISGSGPEDFKKSTGRHRDLFKNVRDPSNWVGWENPSFVRAVLVGVIECGVHFCTRLPARGPENFKKRSGSDRKISEKVRVAIEIFSKRSGQAS